jgi:hypothetical protein
MNKIFQTLGEESWNKEGVVGIAQALRGDHNKVGKNSP